MAKYNDVSLVIGVIKVVFGFLGLFINSVGIFVLIKEKSLRNIFNHIFACSLITDNIYLIAGAIITFYFHFDVKYPALASLVPHFAIPFKHIALTANILITISLSHERYTALANPTAYTKHVANARNRCHRLTIYLAFVVIFSVAFNFPRFFAKKLSEDGSTVLKTSFATSVYYRTYYKGIRSIIFMPIAFTILILFNARIYIIIHKLVNTATDQKCRGNDKSKMTSELQLDQDFNMLRRLSRKLRSSQLNAIKKKDKLTVALFALVTVFTLTNCCFLVEEILDAFDFDPSWENGFEFATQLIVHTNACVNIFIYWMVDGSFKQKCYAVLTHLFCWRTPSCLPSHHTSSQHSSTRVHANAVLGTSNG